MKNQSTVHRCLSVAGEWGGGGQRHAPSAFYPQERPSAHCTRGWVGPRTSLDMVRKISPPPGFDLMTANL
jgi:hypothetical protein